MRLDINIQHRIKQLIFIFWFCLLLVVMFVLDVYTSETPKRVYYQHTTRNFLNGTKDNGIWINVFDENGLSWFKKNNINIPAFDRAIIVKNNHEFPWYLPVDELIQTGYYVPVDKPPNV